MLTRLTVLTLRALIIPRKSAHALNPKEELVMGNPGLRHARRAAHRSCRRADRLGIELSTPSPDDRRDPALTLPSLFYRLADRADKPATRINFPVQISYARPLKWIPSKVYSDFRTPSADSSELMSTISKRQFLEKRSNIKFASCVFTVCSQNDVYGINVMMMHFTGYSAQKEFEIASKLFYGAIVEDNVSVRRTSPSSSLSRLR